MKIRLVAVFTLIVSTSFVSAGVPVLPAELDGVEQYGIFRYYPSVPEALYVQGDTIPSNHELELRKALNLLPKVNTIVLDSPGGDVYSALSMAGVINDKSLVTYVPLDGVCASACSFMFLAGANRFASGQLGVHQFAVKDDRKEDRSKSIAQAQFTMSDLYSVLASFDVPDFVIVKMFATPHSEMYYFTDRELDKISKGQEHPLNVSIENLLALRKTWVNELLAYVKSQENKNNQAAVDHAGEEDKVPSSPSKRLAKPEVAQLQRLLNEHGCKAGPEDGLSGNATRTAIQLFAKSAPATDFATLDTQEKIDVLRATPKPMCIQNPLSKSPQTPMVLSDTDAWNDAFNLVRTKRFEEAKVAFERFLINYPDSERVPYAYFWIGEIYLFKKEFGDALANFALVVDKYKNSLKRPDALYKLGVTQRKMGDTDAGAATFNRLVKEYPAAAAAGLARWELSQNP